MKRFLTTLALGMALSACLAEAPPQPVAFRVGPLLFERPESWKWVKPEGSFRVAQLEKTGAGKSVIVMAFSRFPAGAGGSVQANVERWIGQFSQTSSAPEVQSLPGKICPVTRVKIRGTLKGGTPGGPEMEIADALLLGAILEAEGGMIVVKMAGPATPLTREEKTFDALLSAATEKKP
mgnify:CR=1 FL=1